MAYIRRLCFSRSRQREREALAVVRVLKTLILRRPMLVARPGVSITPVTMIASLEGPIGPHTVALKLARPRGLASRTPPKFVHPLPGGATGSALDGAVYYVT